MMTQALCKSCTVPTSGTELCTFCKSYVAPTRTPEAADHLDAAVARIDAIRTDINNVIRELPEDVPMFGLVDVVNALWNLKNASVLLDKAADTFEATEVK